MTKQVTDKMINTFTQAMLLSMPEVEDHYDQVKLGLEAVFKSLSNTCISDGGYCGVGGFCNQTEVDALKAQVNCLREIVSKVNKPIFIFEQSVREEITRSLEATPEQCLAEVNAKAIEESMPKIINACVKYSVEKYINTSVEMVSVGQLKHLSEIRHHGEWGQAK